MSSSGSGRLSATVTRKSARFQDICSLAESLGDSFCFGPRDLCRMDYVSPNVEALLGVSARLLLTNPAVLLSAAVPEDRPTLRRRLYSNCISEQALEFRVVRPGGEEARVILQTLHIEDDDGTQMIGVFMREAPYESGCTSSNDTSEQRVGNPHLLAAEIEARVAERTAELQAAVRELEGFTSSISHDLRGPLRSIIASAMIVREEYAERIGSEGERQLDKLAASAKKISTLIDELLKISRLGRQPLALTLVDLTALAHEVVTDMPSSAEFVISPDLTAMADSRLMRLVLINLFENAAKYVPPGKKATVEFGRDDRGFFVRDDGIGFDPLYAAKIFMPFERLVSDTEYPGTGVGLSNVQRILERHGQKAWAESTPGQGSTFRFTL